MTLFDNVGIPIYQAMQCHWGHTWNYWNQLSSNTTAVQYQGSKCPYCFKEYNIIVHGWPVEAKFYGYKEEKK